MSLIVAGIRPKLWAVGLKGWVEIRSSFTPLKLHIGTTTIRVKTKRPIKDFWGSTLWTERIDRDMKLTSKVWLGGTLVGRVRASTYRSRAGYIVGNGKCERISKLLMMKVLKREV